MVKQNNVSAPSHALLFIIALSIVGYAFDLVGEDSASVSEGVER